MLAKLGNQERATLLISLSFFFLLFPFFEGAETATGLFVLHSLLFLLLAIVILRYSSFWIPPYLIYFLPFLLALILSSWIAPYKYAAFLDLWDFVMAALFGILIISLFEAEKSEVDGYALTAFLIAVLSVIASYFTSVPIRFLRGSGSFVNPNDFATYCLLILIFGLFVYERTTVKARKVLITISLVVLSLLIALASSRTVFFAGSLFFGLYIWKKKPSRAMAASLLAVMAVSAAFLAIRFLQYTDPFQFYRLRIWKHSLRGVLDNPYLGIGLNMLPFTSEKLNFPIDTELGRYSRIARSADSQYLQILTELGFLGLLTFLFGWIALYLLMRNSRRFMTLTYSFWAVSVIALFSLPFANTAILWYFLFLITFPFAFSTGKEIRRIALNAFTRISAVVLLFVLFALFVCLPYLADREFGKTARAATPEEYAAHIQKAVKYNPFQPYFTFSLTKKIIDARPQLSPAGWLALDQSLNQSIALNPAEPEFYVYRARLFRILFADTRRKSFYKEVVASYQRALYYTPFNVFIRSEFAFFEFNMKHFAAAEVELQRITELEPAYINARLLLAETKLEQGKRKEAQRELEKAEEYWKRYRNYRPSEKYIQRLLLIDNGRREVLRQKLSEKSA